MADALPPELSGLLSTTESAAREGAWAAFLQAHSRLLLHTARSVGHDYDAALDAYAYLLEQLHKDDFHRLRAYAADGRSKFTTWLVVVARRMCVDFVRQRYGRTRGAAPLRVAERAARRRLVDLVAEEIELSHVRDGAVADAAEQIVAQEGHRALEGALARLEPRDRLLVKLRFEDDLAAREIAAVMGFPTPFHVYRRLNAVLATLRASLGRAGVEGSES